MKSVLVLNGPNLDLLETRKPDIDGTMTLADVEKACQWEAEQLGLKLVFRQSNHEGQLIAWIHEAGAQAKQGICIGAVFNPGALARTSIALNDAIVDAELPVIELHISDQRNHQDYPCPSAVSAAARGIVVGFGSYGYLPAINGLHRASIARASIALGRVVVGSVMVG